MSRDTRLALLAGLVAGFLAQAVLHGVYPAATWWMHLGLFVLALVVPPLFLKLASRLPVLGENFPRFVIVGGLTTFVDLGILDGLLLTFASVDTYAHLFPLLATASFVVATLSAFFWNRIWTFDHDEKLTAGHVGRFYAVTLVSFLVNVGLSTLLVWINPLPFVPHVLWANIAKLLATAVSLLMNFFGYKRLVFRA